jgi:hypothetical protein
MHSGGERRVHLEVTWFSVCCAFDFRYAMELVIVTHQLFVLAFDSPGSPKIPARLPQRRTAVRSSSAQDKTPSIDPSQQTHNSS